ncbi:formin-like protein 1 [Tanacetum coccineum]|uniref:Formin-like protein 1 n=1 Tax=Tanacetum coccineum TaxID=301880 RepID=A0ABQ4YIS6_9ASTR
MSTLAEYMIVASADNHPLMLDKPQYDPAQQPQEKVYATQVGCQLCKGRHYTKDCPVKEEGNTLEEAYYTQFRAPYQPRGKHRAAGTGFYQRTTENSSYPD